MKKLPAAAFPIFVVIYFLAALALLGWTQWDCTGDLAEMQRCKAEGPSVPLILLGAAILFFLLARYLFDWKKPEEAVAFDGPAARTAEPEEWLKAEDGRLAVARLTHFGCAMSPLAVLLHLRFIRGGEAGAAQVGMTAEEARALAASLLRMTDKLDEVPRGAVH